MLVVERAAAADVVVMISFGIQSIDDNLICMQLYRWFMTWTRVAGSQPAVNGWAEDVLGRICSTALALIPLPSSAASAVTSSSAPRSSPITPRPKLILPSALRPADRQQPAKSSSAADARLNAGKTQGDNTTTTTIAKSVVRIAHKGSNGDN